MAFKEITPSNCPEGSQLYWKAGGYAGRCVNFVLPAFGSTRVRAIISSDLTFVFYADSFHADLWKY